MTREARQLPSEYRGPLSFAELDGALKQLDGEDLAVRVAPDELHPGLIDVCGVLTRRPRGDKASLNLVVGGTGYVHIARQDVQGIQLVTQEGSFYVTITIRLKGMVVTIADRELVGLVHQANDTNS